MVKNDIENMRVLRNAYLPHCSGPGKTHVNFRYIECVPLRVVNPDPASKDELNTSEKRSGAA